jgi:hypothetical protein
VTQFKKDTEKGECDFCGYDTKITRYREEHAELGHRKTAWLCDVCANTDGGNAWFFPRQHSDTDILRSIAVATNMILDAVNKKELALLRQIEQAARDVVAAHGKDAINYDGIDRHVVSSCRSIDLTIDTLMVVIDAISAWRKEHGYEA